MFVFIKHKLSLWASVATLIFLAALTLFLCVQWGVESGLTAGLIAFLLLGGFEAAWYMCTRKMQKRIDDSVNRSEVADSYSGSENNPTIR